jgi:ABC-type branched-subunit amino acid transport system permease subunit
VGCERRRSSFLHPSSFILHPSFAMSELFGIPTQALFGQLLIGLINGSFYALLSLGLAVIFGLLNIINFAHGAQYMMGAFCAFSAANLGLLLVGADARAGDRGSPA